VLLLVVVDRGQQRLANRALAALLGGGMLAGLLRQRRRRIRSGQYDCCGCG
jgi:hypothetical protein